MELTTEQALQQGVTAHQEGKLQDAERLYRAILQSQPAHPDANHNLGLIAVSVNKTDAALPLFKIALEANPKIEQFWLSYIDALIKENQFYNAKQVIQQGKQKGVDKEKLNTLDAKIGSINKPKNIDSTSPSQAQIDALLEHYQNGRLGAAEKLSISLTERYPTHSLPWKVLGAVLKQTGRTTDSLTPMQKSVQLSLQDAEAHSNLGVTLQELGRLDEAEASCRQAIALKPDFSEAHYNLGVTLQELGRLDEAEASYKQAIALKPDYAEAHNNLGVTLQELGRLDEALANYKQAIALKPDFVDGARNLVRLPVGKLDSDTLNLCEKAFDIIDDSLEYKIKYFFFQGNMFKHRGLIEQSFNLFCKANKLKLEGSKDRIIVDAKKNSDSLMRIDKWMPSPPALAGKRLAKLFIVGPSKSGKSSVEHILNESSHVKALWERIKFNELIKNNGCGKNLSEGLFENLFSKSEGKLFNQGYKVVTSTNPESIFYSDYLMNMLPNAYFIIVKRDILNLSPEIFTSEYNRENLYSYDVNEISRYLDVYNRICETLALKVPDRCLTVSFENIIQAPEDVVDQISRLVGSSLRVDHLKRNVASFEYESLFRNHYAALSDRPK